MILNDRQIKELVTKRDMIKPFFPERLNPFGYDMTLAPKFKILRRRNQIELAGGKAFDADDIIDPFNMTPDYFNDFEGEVCTIPPHSFVLGMSLEYFKMPDDVIGLCLGRSSYSRVGIIPHVTPLEAGWEGYVTIEISNASNFPARVYASKGISQVVFFRGEKPDRNYVAKGGRYNKQQGITLAKGV